MPTKKKPAAKKKAAPNRETNKQKVFVERYTMHWNAARAAREAGYSSKTAYQIASENLRKPHIRAAIAEKLKDITMSADEVLARQSEIARGSLDHFVTVNEDGFAVLDFSGDANEKLHLLKRIKTKRTRRTTGKGENAEGWEDENIEIELHDPQRALEALGKYHNLYTEKDEDGNPITDDQRIARIVEILDAARARRDGRDAGKD